MDLKKVRELIELMKENDLTEIELRTGDDRIALKRGTRGDDASKMMVPAPSTAAVTPAAGSGPPPAPEANDPNLETINSPMVGTFYTAPDPESSPFVEVGSQVSPGQTVCIIEAMKVFNEIQSEVSGVVETIHVQREQAVEYGQALFTIRTNS